MGSIRLCSTPPYTIAPRTKLITHTPKDMDLNKFGLQAVLGTPLGQRLAVMQLALPPSPGIILASGLSRGQ
jgi:hypothetical protein